MKKLKIITFFSILFGIMFLSEIAPVKAEDLNLYGFENLYGHENISCYSNNWNISSDEDSFGFIYNTNFNLSKNQKLYFLLNDPYGTNDSDVFSIYFRMLVNDTYSSFAVQYDIDNGIEIIHSSVILEKLDYTITNSYSYEWYDSFEEDAVPIKETINFKGNLYCLDFSNLEYDNFYLDYINVKFDADGNHPECNKNEGDYAALYNYNDSYFQLLVDEFIFSDPLYLSSICEDNNQLLLTYENVPDYYNFNSVCITDKSGTTNYNLSKKSYDNGHLELVVNDIDLKGNGNNSYTIWSTSYSIGSQSVVYNHSKVVNYVTERVINSCYAYTYAQIHQNAIGFNNGSDIFIKMYDLTKNVRIKNVKDITLSYSYKSFGRKDTKQVLYDCYSKDLFRYDYDYNSKEGKLYELPDAYRKVDVFYNSDNGFVDTMLEIVKNWADAHSYDYFDYNFKTDRILYRDDNGNFVYDLAWVSYYSDVGTLIKGSFYPDSLYVDENGVVRDGYGVEKVGYTYDGYNISDANGNVVEPSQQAKSEAERENSRNTLMGFSQDVGDAFSDGQANLWSKVAELINKIKSKSSNAFNAIKIVITAIVSLFLFFIVYKVVKLIVKIFKK